jgi:hypothetical protein
MQLTRIGTDLYDVMELHIQLFVLSAGPIPARLM